jgi:hypothetical protein
VEKTIVKQKYNSKNKLFNFFMCSDLHIGARAFDEDRLKYDLDWAVENEAKIFMNGDIFDLIVPSDRKRYSVSSDKYAATAQVNCVLEEAYKILEPYFEHIYGIGIGNHESEFIKRHHIDITSILIHEINKKRKNTTPAVHLGYTGFIRLNFKHTTGGARRNFDIFYNHGQGGNAEVTRGMIDLNRYQTKGCDLIWLGHKHKCISAPLDNYIYLSSSNTIISKVKRGLITGCYKKDIVEYDIAEKGYQPDYSEEKMRTTQNQGGAMLSIKIDTKIMNTKIIT